MRGKDYLELRRGAGLTYLGMFFVGVIAVGTMGGDWLDRRYHTSPWLALIGLLLGLIAGFREMARALRVASSMPTARPDPPTAQTGRSASAWIPPVLEEPGQEAPGDVDDRAHR